MAQPQPLKAAFREAVFRANMGSYRTAVYLAAARRVLANPLVLQTGDAAGRIALFNSAATQIDDASSCLSHSMAVTVAAELLALRGRGAVPSEPVAGIDDLRDDHDLRLALVRLQAARDHAQDALLGVEGAYTRLAAARMMLESPIPDAAGRQQAVAEQLHAAAAELQALRGSVLNMGSLAGFAIESTRRIQFQ